MLLNRQRAYCIQSSNKTKTTKEGDIMKKKQQVGNKRKEKIKDVDFRIKFKKNG